MLLRRQRPSLITIASACRSPLRNRSRRSRRLARSARRRERRRRRPRRRPLLVLHVYAVEHRRVELHTQGDVHVDPRHLDAHSAVRRSRRHRRRPMSTATSRTLSWGPSGASRLRSSRSCQRHHAKVRGEICLRAQNFAADSPDSSSFARTSDHFARLRRTMPDQARSHGGTPEDSRGLPSSDGYESADGSAAARAHLAAAPAYRFIHFTIVPTIFRSFSESSGSGAKYSHATPVSMMAMISSAEPATNE